MAGIRRLRSRHVGRTGGNHEDRISFADVSDFGRRVRCGAVVRDRAVSGFGQNRVDASVDREVGGCESDVPQFSGVRNFGDGFLCGGVRLVRSGSRGGSMRAGVYRGGDGLLRGGGDGSGAGALAGAVFRSERHRLVDGGGFGRGVCGIPRRVALGFQIAPGFPEMRFPVRESGRWVVPKHRFLGIELAAVSCVEAVEFALGGGLVLAPSGPGLCDLQTDSKYREALLNADLNLPDSGLAIFLMKGLGLGKLPRTSGLGFLMALLERPELRAPGATVWAMPSRESMARNLGFLQASGVPVCEDDCHLAPKYPATGEVCDPVLLEKTRGGKARFVFVCTGSGSQEKLGFWLKRNLGDEAAICCIGAAIGFLSGDQVAIPGWADRMCLGWLLRCISNPRKFVPRYVRALRLVGLAIRYREKPPPMLGMMA